MSLANVAQQIETAGFYVWPDFLSESSTRETRADLDEIQASGAFQRAKTGQGEGASIQELRRDEIYWLHRPDANQVQTRLWEKLDLLKQELNRALFLGISSFEGHYASYPKGGFYRRHLDCFHADDSRMISFVLYLNEDWKSIDGGRLRIYNGAAHTDIDPRGGTMVCFLSRESEHEVLESFASRFSFTGWFKVGPENSFT